MQPSLLRVVPEQRIPSDRSSLLLGRSLPERMALWDFTSKSLNVLLRFCRMRWRLVVVRICLLIVFKEVVRSGVEVDHCDWSGGNILLHV